MIKKHIPVLVVGLLIVLVALAGGAVYGINKLIPKQETDGSDRILWPECRR